MFGIPTFDLLTDAGKQEFIQYIVNLTRNEIISFTSSYNFATDHMMLSLEHMIGTDAQRPSAGAVSPGTYYTSTDVSAGTTYRSDGRQWVQIAGAVQGGAAGYYGSFYDTTTQTVTAINTATAVTFNTTAEANGVSRGTPTSRIVLANVGTYDIQFSAQIDHASANTRYIYIWLRANGTNVAESAGKIAIQGSSAESVPAWNYIYTSTTSNEYIELMWSTDDTGVTMPAIAAAAPVPGVPSVILTVTQVMNTQTGPQGPAATINVGSTNTTTAGSNATVVNGGSTSAAVFNFTIPGSPTVNVGTTSPLVAGSTPTVTNAGTQYAQVLNFGLPTSPTVNVGTTNVTVAGTNPTVTGSGTQYARVLDFTLPSSPTINVGTTNTLTPGSNATVTASGTQYARVFDFGIPSGPAATVNVASTTTGAPGTSATVVNTGSSNAATLAFTIPEGQPGVGNPPGAIIAFAGTTLPSSYLWCDGSLVSKTTYATLYATLGANRYGTDTATDFYLPDLRSHFPRGTATTGGTVTTNNNNTHNHTLNAFSAATTLNAFNAATTLNAFNAATTLNATTATFSGTTIDTTNNYTSVNVNTIGAAGAHNHNVNGGSTSSTGDHNHNNNGANTGGQTTAGNAGNANRGSGALATAFNGHQHSCGAQGVNGASTSSVGGHNHNNNATSTSSDGGNHKHPITITPAGNVTVTTGTATTNVTAGTASTNITAGTASTNVTAGTVSTDSHLPAYVEVNYIIKT